MASTHQPMKLPATPGGTGSALSSPAQRREVLAELRKVIRKYAITPDQLFGPELSDFVRFRDPETGKTWNGAGRPPNWIRGKDREQFRVR